jgi:hypothetical protein
MNSNNQLEEDLIRLGRTMTPGDDFAGRVMRRIDELPDSRFSSANHRRWWLPIGLSMAASVLLAIGLIALLPRPVKTAPDDHTRLVRTSSDEWQTISERPITLVGDVPAREISRQLFERVRWTDPETHATFERMVPREKATLITLESY